MPNQDNESKYDESIKNLKSIMKTVKDSNLDEDSSVYEVDEVSNLDEDSSTYEIVEDSSSIDKGEVETPENISSKLDDFEPSAKNIESDDIINSTSVIDDEDAEKLSFDKLEIKEEEMSFTVNEYSSQSFEDNILNNVDDVFDQKTSDSNNDKDDDMDKIDEEDLNEDLDVFKSKSIFKSALNISKNDDELLEDDEEDISINKKSKSRVIPIIGVIVGIVTISIGINHIFGRSARVIDSVASGEYMGVAILLIFIGLICLLFSLRKLVSFKTPFDNLAQSINNIDAQDEEIDEDESFSQLDDELNDNIDSIKSDFDDGDFKGAFDSKLVADYSDNDYKITIKAPREKDDDLK
ncbi:hypothetical protein [uncultured Methanobrevibacter sp.]|uniref:hypothetical protein n=1 Tax=uncultured Methanobrevibacter sp. TaxID=253161 RepID=UPI0025F11AF0|nr:hypothetical protein [uncultured Methanobrevibacter sp.]